jgi:isopentenyl-diphosphate delta-isomerase
MPATQPSSLIDVFDAAGRPIGTAPRAEAFQRGLTVRTVHVFVFDSEDRLLVQQLGPERDRHPLLWGSSVAGFPRPGEGVEEAASRRLSEELALTTPIDLMGTTVMRDGDSEKFVTLFETRSDRATIAEPGHIERIEYRDVDAVRDEQVEHPERFTETFRHVFSYWLNQRRRPA